MDKRRTNQESRDLGAAAYHDHAKSCRVQAELRIRYTTGVLGLMKQWGIGNWSDNQRQTWAEGWDIAKVDSEADAQSPSLSTEGERRPA